MDSQIKPRPYGSKGEAQMWKFVGGREMMAGKCLFY